MRSSAFPPGWNGQALAPPMGWRHWQAFGPHVRAGLPGDGSSCSAPPGTTCGSIARTIDLMVDRRWSVDGRSGTVSLADIGYSAVGIDEGWERCGAGVGGHGHHAADGSPLIDLGKFPNMSALTGYAHARGLTIGWYLNGVLHAAPAH